jgi:hypothetical protein
LKTLKEAKYFCKKYEQEKRERNKLSKDLRGLNIYGLLL